MEKLSISDDKKVKTESQYNNISNIGYGQITEKKEEEPKMLNAEAGFKAIRPFLVNIASAEDDLLEMKMRYDALDAMSWTDPKFNEDEYENLEETIDLKSE